MSTFIGTLATGWKLFSCLPWLYWIYIYTKTFDWRRFASVWITWTLSSAILAVFSERQETISELTWHGILGDKLGKSYIEEFASMMLGDQIRQLMIFAGAVSVRSKARSALPPHQSFADTMDLRQADNIYMTFFLACTGVQVFLMMFDHDYQGAMHLSNVWNSSAVTKVVASVSVKSLLYAAGLAAIHLFKKLVVMALCAMHYIDGPAPSIKRIILDWYNNNILLRALVQQTGELILGTLEWLIVQDPLKRARNYTRQMRFRYILKQAKRRAHRSQLRNSNLVRIDAQGHTCLVCFEDFDIGYMVPQATCEHKVHASCWLSILSKGDGKCPHPGCKVRPSMESILEQSCADDIKEALG